MSEYVTEVAVPGSGWPVLCRFHEFNIQLRAKFEPRARGKGLSYVALLSPSEVLLMTQLVESILAGATFHGQHRFILLRARLNRAPQRNVADGDALNLTSFGES